MLHAYENLYEMIVKQKNFEGKLFSTFLKIVYSEYQVMQHKHFLGIVCTLFIGFSSLDVGSIVCSHTINTK